MDLAFLKWACGTGSRAGSANCTSASLPESGRRQRISSSGALLASPELSAAARTVLRIERAPRLPNLRDAHHAKLATTAPDTVSRALRARRSPFRYQVNRVNNPADRRYPAPALTWSDHRALFRLRPITIRRAGVSQKGEPECISAPTSRFGSASMFGALSATRRGRMRCYVASPSLHPPGMAGTVATGSPRRRQTFLLQPSTPIWPGVGGAAHAVAGPVDIAERRSTR